MFVKCFTSLDLRGKFDEACLVSETFPERGLVHPVCKQVMQMEHFLFIFSEDCRVNCVGLDETVFEEL